MTTSVAQGCEQRDDDTPLITCLTLLRAIVNGSSVSILTFLRSTGVNSNDGEASSSK